MPKKTELLLDNQLCFTLYSTSLMMTQAYKALLAPLGITYPQYLVLLTLLEKNGCSLKDIAARMGQKPGALTPVLKRMEADKLLVRERNYQDERAIKVTLTEKGAALESLAYEVRETMRSASGLNEIELVDLRNQLQKLKDNLAS